MLTNRPRLSCTSCFLQVSIVDLLQTAEGEPGTWPIWMCQPQRILKANDICESCGANPLDYLDRNRLRIAFHSQVLLVWDVTPVHPSKWANCSSRTAVMVGEWQVTGSLPALQQSVPGRGDRQPFETPESSSLQRAKPP
jgi:hypothetical protein